MSWGSSKTTSLLASRELKADLDPWYWRAIRGSESGVAQNQNRGGDVQGAGVHRWSRGQGARRTLESVKMGWFDHASVTKRVAGGLGELIPDVEPPLRLSIFGHRLDLHAVREAADVVQPSVLGPTPVGP
jgi:hypothetical protein